MRRKLILLVMAVAVTAFLFMLSGCDLLNKILNNPPVADAGKDQTVQIDTQVTLDGHNSRDPDGNQLTYSWSITSQPPTSTVNNSKVSGASSQVAYFTPDVEGLYIAELKVSDGQADSTDTVSITATASGGGGGGGGGGSAPSAPSINVAAGDAYVTVTWAGVSGATSYNLYYKLGGSVTIATGTKLSNVTSPKDVTGLANGSQYAFIVTAVNSNGESGASNTATATPVLGMPSAPTGLGVTTSGNQLQVTWGAVAGAINYFVYKDTNPTGSYASIAYGGGNTSFTDGPLTSGTTFYYEVAVQTNIGTSGKSAYVAGTTVPAAPSIQSVAAGESQVAITWGNVAGANSYNLYWAAGSTATTGSNKISGVGSPYTVTGLSDGTQYAFIVTAVNAGGESLPSAAQTATPQMGIPTSPSSLLITGASGTTLSLSWSAVGGATGYQLFRDTSSGGSFSTQRYSGSALSFTDSNLTQGTTYYYKVRASNGAGTSPLSNWQSGTTIPSSPTASAVPGDGQVTVSWAAVPGATSYNVYYAAGSSVTIGGAGVTTVLNANSPCLVSSLTDGIQYAFIVTAVNSGGESAASSPATATPQPGLPSTPQNLWVPSATASSLTVQWDAVSGTGVSYVVYRATDQAGPYGFQAYSGTSTSFTSNSLASGTTYYFEVKAHNASGFSALSTPSSGTTLPAAPSISVTAGDQQVTVSWASVAGADSYYLYYKVGASVTTATGSMVAGVTSPYIMPSLANGTQYAFIVTASDSSGEGAASNVATGTPAPGIPQAPSGLTVFSPTGTSLSVAWNYVSGATSYQVYRDTAQFGTYSFLAYNGNSTGFTDTGLSSATTYYYEVRATNASGSSSLSAPVSGTTSLVAPNTPVGLSIAGVTANTVTVSWVVPSGATSVQLYRDTSQLGSFSLLVYSGSASSYQDTGLSGGTDYYYKVQATNDAGSSSKSAWIKGTTTTIAPSTPTGLLVGNPTSGSLDVSWNASPGATWYSVTRSTDATFVVSNNVYNGGATGFTDTGVASSTTYYYKVSAGNSAGSSLQSAAASGTTQALTSGEGGYGYGIR